jgi:phosphoribosylaminoimidazolecarboxamide formyltransferase / IMP cyclohydrolase
MAAGGTVRIGRALISVSDKSGLAEFAAGLAELGAEIVSTGGTQAALREAGVECRGVEELTGFPEILDGRVKTLHPLVHAGILAVRDDPSHAAALEEHGVLPIDLVCVNLYPFERTVTGGADEEEAIEQIDVGGPTMIRAAAKNHAHVAVVVSPSDYEAVLEELRAGGGTLSFETRRRLAGEAFAHTARYDAAIAAWFGQRESGAEPFPERLSLTLDRELGLAYGENPQQSAALYAEAGAPSHVLSGVEKLHGKPLSFNNVLDLDAARRLLDDLEGPACAIVKHNNPCGAAVAGSAEAAYQAALACDPLSAFGGVVALNQAVDESLAKRLHELFIEVLYAPGFEPAAIDVLTQKEGIRILDGSDAPPPDPAERDYKRVRGGLLVQDRDAGAEGRGSMKVVTESAPTEDQWRDLEFAWVVCRHVRSNAIVIVRDGATLGIGAGQMSRVDSVRLAIDKARGARGEQAESLLRGAVLASDAFFPFADGPQMAIEAGVTAIVQPGGSKGDTEVIAACDAAGVAMAFTGRRHFRH